MTGPVLSEAQRLLLLDHLKLGKHINPAGWFKGHAGTDRLIYDIATSPHILDLLEPLIGKDIILWGASVVERAPGQAHPWHVDKESSAPDQHFATAWIGLHNTCRESGLSLIGGSHLFPKTVQEVHNEKQSLRGRADDETVLRWAREMNPHAELLQPDIRDRDAILFDGRIWHGSLNKLDTGLRTALLLQYASADAPVFMLDPATLDWAYRSNEVRRPPVILVRGAGNNGRNNLISPPPTTPTDAPEINITVSDLRLPLAGDPGGGWKPHYLFAGHTSVHDYLTCHASVLSPGKTPHPPHSHIEEEILLVLDGEAELLIGDGPDPDNAIRHAAGPGTLAYYPAYQHHTLRNSGTKALTYLMFKWRGAPVRAHSVISLSVVEFGTAGSEAASKPHHATRLLEGPTNFLSKLEIHCSEVQPGGGYEPHRDDYDVAIVMLSGEVETLGRNVGPCDVIYCAANEPHGLRGLGTEPARYLVIEFHGDRDLGGVRERLKGIIPDDARTFLRRLEVFSRRYPAVRRMVPQWLKGVAKSLLN